MLKSCCNKILKKFFPDITFLSSKTERGVFAVLVVLILLFFLYPFLSFLIQTFFPQNLEIGPLLTALMDQNSVRGAILNSFILAFSVTAVCLLLGVPLAWLIARSDLPARRLWNYLLGFPFIIPPFIGAIAWIQLANPQTGWLNHFSETWNINVYSWYGLIWIESSFLYTIVYFNCLRAFENMDASLEEAARVSGASPLRVFFDINIPVIFPQILSSAVLVLTAILASFGVPAMIGGPARLQFITTQIYQLQKIGTYSGLVKSGLLATLLLIFALLVFAARRWIVGNSPMSLVSGKSSRASFFHLRQYKWWLFSAICLFFSFSFILPVLGIIISATSKVQGVVGLDNFTLDHFVRILFNTEETFRAIRNSTVLAGSCATVAVVFSFFWGFFESRRFSRTGRRISTLINLPYAAPGTVVALALILAFSRHFFGLPFNIYNTLWILGIAYFIKFLNFSLRPVADSFGLFHGSLEEASRVSGANTWMTLIRIWLPLLLSQLLSVWLIVFIPAFAELTMSVLLTGPGTETVGTLIFQMQEYADMTGGGAAVLSVLILMIVFVFQLISIFLSRKGRIRAS